MVDKLHKKHLMMSGEIEDDAQRVVVCPDCRNEAVPRSDDSSHTFWRLCSNREEHCARSKE